MLDEALRTVSDRVSVGTMHLSKGLEFRAVAVVGKLRLTGFVAWLMWLAVHLFYITGFKNRVTAVLHWLVSFLGRGRSERTATEQQIFGRTALQRLDRGAADLVSPPDPEQARRTEERRAELEAAALEESRLTDEGARGANLGEVVPAGHSK